jgi:hypothetical protein
MTAKIVPLPSTAILRAAFVAAVVHDRSPLILTGAVV